MFEYLEQFEHKKTPKNPKKPQKYVGDVYEFTYGNKKHISYNINE